jgi:hypothetical protein
METTSDTSDETNLIFVCAEHGNDDNDGRTEQTAVRTLGAACNLIDDDRNVIYVRSGLQIS